MSHNRNMVAVDLGASSGRAILGRCDGNRLALEEISRFANTPVYAAGTLYWDILCLYRDIKNGLDRAAIKTKGGIASIGIDAWGNDFGLLDRNGCLIGNPVHYRDGRTKGMMEKVFEIIPKESVFRQTGIQFMRLNGLYQLFSMARSRQPALEEADKLLLVPDLINYYLSGICSSEFTIATTTQMVSPAIADWAREMLGRLGIPLHIFTNLTRPGTVLGGIADRDCLNSGLKQTKVIAVAEHDTGSAVVAVPAEGDDFIYISSGTWSLIAWRQRSL